MSTIKLPTIKPLASRTDAEKAQARADDKATHKILRRLARSANNKGCADCTSRSSGWGVLPHGVFVCIHCAQLHRHIGRHVSQTKAFNTGTYLWYKDEVAAMRMMGNARANAVYASRAKGAPSRPAEDAPRDEKLAYVRSKYEKRRWFDAAAPDPLAEQAQDGGGATVAPKAAAKPAPAHKHKLRSKFNTKAGRRKRSSLLGANKAPADGWAAWGTTASDAYDSAHEAVAEFAQAEGSPPLKPAAPEGKEGKEADLLDFDALAISAPAPLPAPQEPPVQERQVSGDYAKKQAYVLSVMRQTGPVVGQKGGCLTAQEKVQACRLFGPPARGASLGHIAPPQKVAGTTGFFESFGLAS